MAELSESSPVDEDRPAGDAQVEEDVAPDIGEDESGKSDSPVPESGNKADAGQTSPYIDRFELESISQPRRLKIAPLVYAASGIVGAGLTSSAFIQLSGTRGHKFDNDVGTITGDNAPAIELFEAVPDHSMPFKLGFTAPSGFPRV